MQRHYPLAIFLGMLLAGASHAQAPDKPGYSAKQSAPSTGTSIRKSVATSALPLDKRYDQLTEAQKADVQSQYVDMKPEDEPPFPLEGLGKLYENLSRGAGDLRLWGKLSLLVHVDSKGEATSVEVLKADDAELDRFAAHVAMLTRFKPAVCAGQPCAMGFPLRLNLVRGNW